MPRLAIVGHGKMGRAVEQLAAEHGWTIAAVIDAPADANATAITARSLGGADVAVEFTTGAAAPANIRACVRAGCPVVSGSTGWDAQRADVEENVLAGNGALLWSPNFSIGVNVFWQVAELAARLAGKTKVLDAHIVETHHAAKRDAPSGTALALQRLATAAFGSDIPVSSVRVGSVPGTHELVLDGAFEQIRVVHEARDRRVFAEGALLAARWLVGRRGVYTMRDFLMAEVPPA
ncbi:MAG TPA: dihydrodipicolinate reductase C-terminal domain-containing protein [Myxococcota bacterium]|jgi:4-hydroxy-tetrahydrodipicolinate reductase